METIITYLQTHIMLAPAIIFCLLTAAGANVPLSEDLLNIAAASLAAAYPRMAPLLAVSVLLGAFSGDQVSYWFGRAFEPVIEARFVRKKDQSEHRKRHYERYHRRIAWVEHQFSRHTRKMLILGRYIPFGFRNILHMGAGYVKIPYGSYLLYDIIGVLATTGVIFWSVFIFGSRASSVIDVFKYAVIIFILLGASGYGIWQRAMKHSDTQE